MSKYATVRLKISGIAIKQNMLVYVSTLFSDPATYIFPILVIFSPAYPVSINQVVFKLEYLGIREGPDFYRFFNSFHLIICVIQWSKHHNVVVAI